MFLHCFKYDMKLLVRNKGFLFWLIAFPILLGTFFNIAFSNIQNTVTIFSTIDVALVNSDKAPMLGTAMESVEMDGSTPMFSVSRLDEAEALTKLRDEDVTAVVYADTEKVSVLSGSSMEKSIVKEFMDTYRMNEKIIMSTYTSDEFIPGVTDKQNEAVISILQSDAQTIIHKNLTKSKMDFYDQYFYNLIAMVAFMGSTTGLTAAVMNQANMSAKAMRKGAAPVSKLVTVLSGLLSGFAAQTICIVIAISYVVFALGKDLGSELPLVYLSGITGGFAGVSFGFFIGSLGAKNETRLNAMVSTFTMFCCYLSGLMAPMKKTIEDSAPFINKINPAALISDMFYCLNIYEDHSIYLEKLISIAVITVIFTALTIIFARRKKYASL